MKTETRIAMNRLSVGVLASVMTLGAVSMAQAAGTHYQTANMIDFGSGGDVDGGGTLTRTEDSLRMEICTTGLDKKAGYTTWWVIFNYPDECDQDGCGLNDLGNPAVGASVFYAAGFVTGTDGSANVTAHLEAGVLAEGIDVLILGPGGLAAGNGLAAEAHLIVRSHGALIAGLVADQIGTFNGACDLNSCEDQQALVFLAGE